MCGRYTLTFPDAESLADALGATLAPDGAAAYRPRYNGAPGDVHVVVRARDGGREIVAAKWGLVSPHAEGPEHRPINARSESVRKRAPFRAAFEAHRCVVPATGFFEWTGPKKARRPIWFHPPEAAGLLHFAGVYEIAAGARSFAILTTAANDVVAPVHDRMPAILLPRDVDRWLSGTADEAFSLLAPAPPELLVSTAVSPRANSVAHDDPACLESFDPEAEPDREQLDLFGSRR